MQNKPYPNPYSKANCTDTLLGLSGDPDILPEWQLAMDRDSKEGWHEYANFLEALIMGAVSEQFKPDLLSGFLGDS